MAYNHEYPYVDPNRYNADWILHKIQEIDGEMDEFKAINTITNAGTWDITKQYKAWTIVSDNNIGYISFKPVPAGIPITNTEYWGMIADYDIVISDLADRIIALENEMNAITPEVANNTSLIVNGNSRGTIVLFGDSWFANNNTMATYIARHFGCNIKNYSYGGTGFNVPNGYKDQLEVMANDATLDLDDVRFCIIMCGLNDHSINPPPRRSFTPDEFIQAFIEWKAIYNTKFAGHVLPSVYWFHNYSLENEKTYAEEVVNPTTYWDQYVYYRTIRRGIREIKSCNCFGFVQGDDTYWDSANWRHLTNAGYTQYAENMCAVIDGAKPTIYRYEILTGQLPASYTYRDVITDFVIEDDILKCYMSIPTISAAQFTASETLVTYPKYLPAAPDPTMYFAMGLRTSSYTYANKTIGFRAVAAVASQYSGIPGRVRMGINTSIS